VVRYGLNIYGFVTHTFNMLNLFVGAFASIVAGRILLDFIWGPQILHVKRKKFISKKCLYIVEQVRYIDHKNHKKTRYFLRTVHIRI